MTRFDADDPADRQLLYAEAISAHRTRGSPYLTIEAEITTETGEDDGADGAAPSPTPWVQFGDNVFNLDCTDTELDRLKDLLREFPAFTIEALERPEDAEGTNVRVSAMADEKRLAEFVERTFRVVYELEEDYRAWVVEV